MRPVSPFKVVSDLALLCRTPCPGSGLGIGSLKEGIVVGSYGKGGVKCRWSLERADLDVDGVGRSPFPPRTRATTRGRRPETGYLDTMAARREEQKKRGRIVIVPSIWCVVSCVCVCLTFPFCNVKNFSLCPFHILIRPTL